MSETQFNYHPRQSKSPLVLILLGALAFSLSSPPGNNSISEVNGVSFSSEVVGSTTGECDLSPLSQNSSEGATATCYLNQRHTNGQNTLGHVEVRIVSERRFINDTKPEQKLAFTVFTGDKSTPLQRQPITTSLTAIDQFMKKEFAKIANAEADAKKAEADRQKDIDDCKIADEKASRKLGKDEKPRKLGKVERMDCLLRNFANMDEDDEVADTYFRKNIERELKGMLGSDDERSAGLRMLKKLKNSDVGGTYVEQSLRDLRQYAMKKGQFSHDKNSFESLLADDPNGSALGLIAQNMRIREMFGRNYFTQRQRDFARMNFGEDNAFDYGSALKGNAANMNYELYQEYAQFAKLHEKFFGTSPGANPNLNPNPNPNVNGSNTANDPRNARAPWPSNNGMQPQVPPKVPPQAPQGPQQQKAVANSGGGGSYSIPTAGQPVTIRRK
jgi:hypothetical protein